MIIEITTSGGFGGISSVGIQKSVDVKALAEPDKSKIYEAFDLINLGVMARKTGHPGAADGMKYKIIIVDDENQRHEFDVNESALPAAMLDMIDEM
ncbi:MAG: protealysin inhibitor emfourin [Rhizobiaceae bacterium]